jgi:hypothetical protein
VGWTKCKKIDMADTEKVAESLHKFTKWAIAEALARPIGDKHPDDIEPTPRRQHHAILTVYEKCLGRLKPDELAQLDGIIEKMSGAAR